MVVLDQATHDELNFQSDSIILVILSFIIKILYYIGDSRKRLYCMRNSMKCLCYSGETCPILGGGVRV